ncbi:MAG TPA: Ig-like domain-containing protein, partial [Candidatus Paceibacterota bacterium]
QHVTFGKYVDLSSGTGTFTVDTTALANGTYNLDVQKLVDAAGNLTVDQYHPSGIDSYFKNYVIQNYTYNSADSKFTADPEYIRANNSGDTSSIALVPAAATAAHFTYTQTDGAGVYDDVAGTEHIQAGQFPIPSTGQHQYRGGVSAGAGVYTVTGEYEVGGTWYPITGSATLYVLGNPTGSFVIPNSSGAVFRPGDNPLRVKAGDANSTFSRVTFAVDGTNYTVNRADCDLRAAGNYVLCDAKAAGNWPAAGLSAGTHTASATLYNQANNHTALAPVTFTVDGAAPAVTDFTTDMPTPGTLALSAVATDDQGIASVAFSITTPRAGDGVCDGNGVPLASATVTSGTGDTYAASLDDSALPSGTYCANVVAGDVAANHSHPQSLKIDIDHTAPTTPENGQPNEAVLATNNFTFTWDASTDASGPVTYDYQATQDPAETDGVLTNGLWTPPAPLTVPSIASSGAGDGAWYWQVRAKDAAGNYSDWSPIWNVTLDTTAPAAPALFSPADGATVNGASVTQEWSDSDPTVDHYVYESYDDAAATSLRFTGTYPTTSKTATNVGDTTFWWRVAAVDAAGNQSAWSPLWQLTVDNASGLGHPTNTPPVADNQTVEVTQGEAFDITLTGSDADHDALTFAAAAPAHGTLAASSTNPAVVTYTADADYAGTDSFTFTANDGTEDSAAATVGITVDAAASTNSTTHHFSAKTKSQGTSGGSVLGAETFNFTRDLTIGSTGDDVTALQQILIDAGLLNIPAPTGYFGPLTRAALAFFQRLHGIVPAVGYFGPITRALLNGGSF